jgi:hypothetical protein
MITRCGERCCWLRIVFPFLRTQAGGIQRHMDEALPPKQDRASSTLAPVPSSTVISGSKEGRKGAHLTFQYVNEALRVPLRPPIVKKSHCRNTHPNPVNPKYSKTVALNRSQTTKDKLTDQETNSQHRPHRYNTVTDYLDPSKQISNVHTPIAIITQNPLS